MYDNHIMSIETRETTSRHSLMTQRLIAQALKTLMSEKPLEKITIQNIADLCGIKRQTFYYHFRDIYDALEWLYEEETVSILQQFSSVENWEDPALLILKYMQENSAACLNVLNSMGNKLIRKFFFQDFYTIYHKAFINLTAGYDLDPKLVDFFARMTVYAIEGSAINWLEEGMKRSPEELVTMVGIYLDGMINILINHEHNSFDFKKSNTKKAIFKVMKQKRIG